jgi:hypothetical protein
MGPYTQRVAFHRQVILAAVTLSVIAQSGQVFDYFDELRKVIEPARTEVFFVDPYLNPNFVSRYLPHLAQGVAVRLLGWKGMPALVSAVDVFAQQSKH